MLIKKNKMKLLDVLKKYVIPSVLTTISIDSYRRQLVGHSQELNKLELAFARGAFCSCFHFKTKF